VSSPSPGCVVLAYGADRIHEPLVESLLAEGLPPRNIVIVHNPAQLEEPPLPSPPVGVTVLHMGSNLGYAGGMNVGIRHFLARPFEWILLLTHDVRFHPHAIRRLLAAAGEANGFGLLGPALRWTDERLYYGALRDRIGEIRYTWEDPPRPDPAAVIETDWVQGSAMLARREVFEQVGLLDERFFMYVEETELCLRAARAGWRIGVVAEAIAEQQHGHLRRPALHSYLIARNGPEYIRRAAGSRGVVVWLWRQLLASWELLKIWKGRRSAAPQRRQARTILLAMWQGTAAFFARRWGVPPAWLWKEEL
jgi:GT2 family glycosyltransferase